MNINFTPTEYKLLLDMLSIADWVLHAHAINKEDYHLDHEALKGKILSFSKAMGAEDLIENLPGDTECYETIGYENYIHDKFINPYDEKLFWDKLSDRLSERDLIQSLGMEQFQKLDFLERLDKLNERKEHYSTEFAQNGVTKLDLIRS